MQPHARPYGNAGHLALVQPRVGIGDMVWHLPHIAALVAAWPGPVTLLARPRSCADQLVDLPVMWIERDQWLPGGRHQGVRGAARLVSELRAARFDAAVLLTRSRLLTLAMVAAGVPVRHGYGVGRFQRALLRPPYLPSGAERLHPHAQAGAWLLAAGVALPDAEPVMAVPDAARVAVRVRVGRPGPWAALGIAASDAWKKWPLPSFAALARHMLGAGYGTVLLLGGPAEKANADAILALLPPDEAVRVVPVLGWDLREVAALLAECRVYAGNDTGVLNIAAAVGTRSVGLFGATPVLAHSRLIVPIVPPGGPDGLAGMERIGVGEVVAAIGRIP